MIRALLVDDHALLRRVLRRFLERSGEVEVVGEADEGDEALQKAESLHPDVVLLDFLLPETNALRVVRQLKEMPASPKVVILTAIDDTAVKELSLAAGADAFVPKSQAAFHLVQTVKDVGAQAGQRPA